MIEIRGVAKSFAAPAPARRAAWWGRRGAEAGLDVGVSAPVSAATIAAATGAATNAPATNAARTRGAATSAHATSAPAASAAARNTVAISAAAASVAGGSVDAAAAAAASARGLRVHAVRDVSLVALDGHITGLLGPNGAGKTTTLRMLAALIAPDAGTMHVDGIDVVARPRDVLARTGFLSDSRGLYPRLTARENIVYYGALHGMEREAADARAQDLARMFDMVGLLDRRATGFSQGERMKTALARALVHDPANIVLDEPTNGLDVLATRALRENLRWLRTPEGGSKCIVFSTHIMQEVERLCDSVVVVARGRTVATGAVPELLAETGESDFEEAFVKLAFGPERASVPDQSAHAGDRGPPLGAQR